MSFFSIDNLKNLNENKSNRNIIVNDEDSSFFIESLNMILTEAKNDARNMIISKRITSLAVSNPSEAIAVIDHKLDKFISDIEKLLRKFETTMNRLGSKTSLVKSYTLKDFTSIKHPIKFGKTISNYTNIGIHNARTSLQTELSEIYSILLRNLEKFGKIKNLNDFDKLKDKISSEKDINIGDKYKSKVIARPYDPDSDNVDFYDALKKYFTGDGDESEYNLEELVPKYISMIAKEFYSNSDLIMVKKECKELISNAKEMQSNLRKLDLDTYITTASNKQEWYNYSAYSTFYAIINNAIYNTQMLCNVYLKYIAAKMEAAINARTQDIKILKYVINHKDDNNKGGK